MEFQHARQESQTVGNSDGAGQACRRAASTGVFASPVTVPVASVYQLAYLAARRTVDALEQVRWGRRFGASLN